MTNLGFISPSLMSTFIAQQNLSHKDFMSKEIVWKKCKGYLQPFDEDYSRAKEPNDDGYLYIPLMALCNFNYARTWPVSQDSESGKLDRQSIQVYFSIDQLSQLGYVNTNGNFDYDPGMDRFIINGIPYRNEGDTPASQIPDSQLVFTMVLRPDPTSTGSSIR